MSHGHTFQKGSCEKRKKPCRSLLQAGGAWRRARLRIAENPVFAERESRSRNRSVVEGNIRIGERHGSAALQAGAVEGDHGAIDRDLAAGVGLDANRVVGELRAVDPDVVAAGDREAKAVSERMYTVDGSPIGTSRSCSHN